MRAVAFLVGMLVTASAWSAQIGLRPFLFNGQLVAPEPERDQAGLHSNFVMVHGDVAIIEVFVRGIEPKAGDPLAGIGVFDFTVMSDPTLIEISNPNRILRGTRLRDIAGKEFLPLRPHPFVVIGGVKVDIMDAPDNDFFDFEDATIDCEEARGGDCMDAGNFLASTGRDLFPVVAENQGGKLHLSFGSANKPDKIVIPTPVGGGVIGLFQIKYLGGNGGIGTTALEPTELTLIEDVTFLADGAGNEYPSLEVGTLSINWV